MKPTPKPAPVPPTTDEIFRRFRLFNEKVDVLENRSFRGKVMARDAGIRVRWTADGDLTTTRIGADEESTESYILTLRLFLQEKDGIGITQVLGLYEHLNVPDAVKAWAKSFQIDYEAVLDSTGEFHLTLQEELLTNRRILVVFIYGGFAHVNADKRPTFELWRSLPNFGIVESKFELIVHQIGEYLMVIRDNNKEAIRRLLI